MKKLKSKIFAIILIIAFLFPGLSYSQTTSQIMKAAEGANTTITPSLTAVTGRWIFLTCYEIEVINGATPSAGVINITSTSLPVDITITVTRQVDVSATNRSFCFDSPVRARNQNTAITFSGVSGHANTTLRITLYGYSGI